METLENNLVVVSGKQSTDNYPYGSLKCTMTFDIEFKPNKGFRFVTQSINPKTGRLNAPKASTYTDFMVMTKDATNEHFSYLGGHINGWEDVERVINMINQYQIELPADQREYLYIRMINTIRQNYPYVKQYFSTPEEFKTVSKLSELIQLYKVNAPILELTKLDFSAEKINSFKK